MLILESFVFGTVLIGFFGIIFKKNLMMKIISMDVMSTGVIAFYVFVASRSGLFTPILSGRGNGQRIAQRMSQGVDQNTVSEVIAYADPVPQAVILTAIVIGFSIQALMLVGVMKLARDNPLLDTADIERSQTP